MTEEDNNNADVVVELNSGLSDAARIPLYLPVIHMMGYYRAMAKGLDPDNPRHLTQVVILDD